MSPIVQEYLNSNIGKVVEVDEFVLWLLFNELMYQPETYGIESIDPIGAYYEPGEKHDELWSCLTVGVVMPKGTILFKRVSVVETLPEPNERDDGYAPHEESFRYWLWDDYGGEALSHTMMRDLEQNLKPDVHFPELAGNYLDLLKGNQVLSVEIRAGRTKFVMRVPKFLSLERTEKTLLDWEAYAKTKDAPKGLDKLLTYLSKTLGIREYETMELCTFFEPGILEVTVYHGNK